jgi:hypothetical protein
MFSEPAAEMTPEMASFDTFSEAVAEAPAPDSDWGDLFSDSSVELDQNGQMNELNDLFQENADNSNMELLDMFKTEETNPQSSETSSNGHMDLDSFDDLFSEEVSNKSQTEEKI